MAKGRAPGRLLFLLAAVVAAGVLGMAAIYFANPLGTASPDPRARMLGYMVYRMPSVAMAPTLVPGDVVMADTTAYRISPPLTGDVVVYYPPDDPSRGPLIGRVVAVGGERAQMRDGVLLVDGRPRAIPPEAAPASVPGPGRDMAPLAVPAGHVFVMGDNRDQAWDSRYFGPVPREAVVGRMATVLR